MHLFGTFKRLQEWNNANITVLCSDEFDRQVPNWGYELLIYKECEATSTHNDCGWRNQLSSTSKNNLKGSEEPV